ncbi:MAG: hypothetical protein ABI165_04615, partial [Bryobacteraceae bacterium]
APHSASEIIQWIDKQSGDDAPEDCFRGLKAHFLLMPWFLEMRMRGDVNCEFQRDLVYSSINAYYFVRLLDNISDGHSPGDLRLLPLVALFHSNFQAAYSVWFEPRSLFWEYFNRLWIGMADATVLHSGIRAFSESDFVAVSSQKIAAVKIPVAAVCVHYQRPDLLGSWLDFYDRFACFHEMLDDFCDWHADLAHGRSSFLLSEAARRKDSGESMEAYLLRGGLEAGYSKMEGWLGETRSFASRLDSELLNRYLQYRSDQLARFWGLTAPCLALLSGLANVLEGRSDGSG